MQYNIKLVQQWGIQRGLTDQTTDALRSQFIKGVEEGGEIFDAILKRDKDELVDAIGDRLIVLTLECMCAGLDPLEYIKRQRYAECMVFNSFETAVKSDNALRVACNYGSAQGRFARAIAKQDSVNDHVVNIVRNLNEIATLLCVDIGECYRIAYTVIRDRTGSTVDGVFVKDE